MLKKITHKLLKEEITDREVKFVNTFASKMDHLDWESIRDELIEMGYTNEESMLLILKTISSEDTDWDEDPLELFELGYWFSAFGKDTLEILKEHGLEVDIDFSDTYKVGDKVYLSTDGWCDFKPFFDRNDGNIFESYFCDEDHFRMYDLNTSFDDAWDSLNKKCIDYIKDYLNERFLNTKVTLSDSENLEDYLDSDVDSTITLSSDLIDRLTDDELKDLIKNSPELDNLEHEIEMSLEGAYNTVSEREISEKFMDEITDLFGKGKWDSVVRKDGIRKDKLIFEITDLFNGTTENYIFDTGINPSDDYNYFLTLVQDRMDSSLNPGDLSRYDPYVTGDDMYEELTNRF